MRLLIVEDNAQMREMIKFFLTDLAEEIAECDDGAEALAGQAAGACGYVLKENLIELRRWLQKPR